MPKDNMIVTIEEAGIIFRNFAGREGQFNKPGERNFCVVLDEKTARTLAKDGWNVKFPEVKNEEMEEARDPYIQVTVKYKIRPPKIIMITSGGRTFVTEDMVEILDGLDFENVDLTINASHWDVNGKTGIKAYLRSMYVTIEEDALDRKYAIQEG